MQSVLGALVAVEGDGEAVHLVLYLREHTEELRVSLQANHLWRKAVEQLVGAVTVVLGKARDGYLQVEFILHNFPDDIHLALSAIGDDEVGQGCAFLFHATVAAAHHLLHGGIVVGTYDRLDVIFAIVFLRGLHAFVDNASCYGIRAGDVGVVEAFYLVGELGQLQPVLQFLHQSCLFLFGVELVALLQTVEFILLAVHL